MRADEYDDYPDQDESLSLPAAIRDPIGVLRRQYRWALATIVLTSAAAIAAAMLIPPRYEAHATIMLTAKSIPDEFVPTTIIADIVEQFSAIRSEVFSREHLSQIIEETGVYKDENSTTSRVDLVKRLRRDLVVEPVLSAPRSRRPPSSVAFQITMTGTDPQIVADVVNRTVADLINENVEYRSRQARLTTQFMQREYARADAALREHQRKLAEFREKNRGALPEERMTAISRLDRLEEQRRSAILRLNDLQTRLEYLDAKPESLAAGDELETLRAQLRNAKSLYTDDHPTVRSLERQVDALESGDERPQGAGAIELLDERARIQESMKSEQRRLSQIDEEVDRLEGLLTQTSQIAEEYAALLRLEQVLQENYVEYLRKVKSAELALSLESAQQGAQLTRIDPAIVPTKPVIPRWQIAAGGFVLALGLGALVAFSRELLDPVVIDERHMEEVLSVPFLGSISEIR